MPYKVYSQLTALLNRDWLRIAGVLFHLTLEKVVLLKDSSPEGHNMDAIFLLMCERQIKLGQLVEVLMELQRFDAISLLTEAGYPDVDHHNPRHPGH